MQAQAPTLIILRFGKHREMALAVLDNRVDRMEFSSNLEYPVLNPPRSAYFDFQVYGSAFCELERVIILYAQDRGGKRQFCRQVWAQTFGL
jgi:hypothetical protein